MQQRQAQPNELAYIGRRSDTGKWRVRVPDDQGRRVLVGEYSDLDDAIAARDEALTYAPEWRSLARTHVEAHKNVCEASIADDAHMRMPIAQSDALRDADEAVTIPSGDCLVIGDLHVPYHNADLLEKARRVAAQHGITTVAIIGDLFDFGAISRHPRTERQAALDDELTVAGDVLRALLDGFDHCYICNGNHDERVARAMNSPLGLDKLIAAALGRNWPACSITVTSRDYLYLGEQWLLGHPSRYSGRGGTTPSDLADLEQRNIVTGHNHLIGLQQSKSGRYVGIDTGHCTLPDRHGYVRQRLTTFPRWNGGFTLIQDGYATLYTERFTNWN
jgi:predicted phosphodiesterase